MRLCSVGDCDMPLLAKGMCSMHYQRARRGSDPNRPPVQKYRTPRESFEARTERQGDCLIWTGGLTSNGYGSMHYSGKAGYAHRYAWEVENGPVPDGSLVDHVCHNKRCVEVRHLRLATKSQNGAHRASAPANSVTGIRGVSRASSGTKWMAQVTIRPGVRKTRLYESIDEAAKAVKEWREDYFGEFAGN